MPVYECGIAVRSFGKDRTQEGDIVVARTPLGYIGQEEDSEFLWLKLSSALTPGELTAPLLNTDDERVGKREHKLDIDTLAADEKIDAARVRDPGDKYQPLLDKEVSGGGFTKKPKPVKI